MPITMDQKDASLTVAEPLRMLEAGRKRTCYFSYPLVVPSRYASYRLGDWTRDRTMQRVRPYLLLAVAGTSLMLGACAVAPESPDGVLDPRLAGPCSRLILSWPEDPSRLRALMGEDFEPRTAEGVGELQLNVLRCDRPEGRQPPLMFAFLSVPILADSAPFVITRMPDDGWAWLPAMIADSESRAVFSAMGYDTESAEMLFDVGGDSNDSGRLIAAQLMFESGRVSITARTTGGKAAHTANRALLSTDPVYHSVFFGSETADRYEALSVDVVAHGETPLAAIDLNRHSRDSVFDSELRFDRMYWRLPRRQP